MYQKLVTKEIESAFKSHPYGSQENVPDMDKKVIAKFFNPYGAGTWIICEAEKVDGDWCLYGFCSLGMGYEFGPVMLSEIAETTVPPFNMHLERDMYLPKNCKVGDLISQSEMM